MILESHSLEAFVALARARNFSLAAKAVGITQPAFSIRIRELERKLGTTLVKRMRGEIALTEAGQELLRYCKLKSELENEVLLRIGSGKKEGLGGAVRIAGSSSVIRPVIFKALAPFIRKNPRLHVEFFVRELIDLEGMLHRAETDFVLLNTKANSHKEESILLGHEKIVVIESARHRMRNDVFLDADPKDLFTEKFFRIQGITEPYRRSYVQDEFGIIEGVALGLGRAVVHEHMIPKGLAIRIARGFKPYQEPVVLHFIKQPYYSDLHKAIVAELQKNVPALLGA